MQRPQKPSFRCTECNYRFTPKTERDPSRCPYCSSGRIMPERDIFDVNTFLQQKSPRDEQ